MSDLIGQRLGPYEIKSLMGKGGMATVYRAYQTSMKRDIAIKVMDPVLGQDPEFLGRFQREAELFAVLQHPHILPVIDFGQQDNSVYIVMRLVEGGSLDARLRQGPLPLPLAARLLGQLGSALSFAHERGIVHRDLKPNNVLLDDNDNAYLTDFGIAKMLAGTSRLTATNEVLGTPAYMAPEQWRGDSVDARTDIYSLGIMAFEMVTGQLPFQGDTSFTLMYKHINDAPPHPKQFIEHLNDAVEVVILQSMAKDPAERFQSANSFGEAFRTALEKGTFPTAYTPPPNILNEPATMVGMADDKTMATPLPTAGTFITQAPHATPSEHATYIKTASRKPWGLLALLAVIVLGAALAFAVLQGSGDDDQEAKVTPTEEPTATETLEPTATDTPQPTPADTETPTPTDTPSIASVSVLTQRSILRSGPGDEYEAIGTLEREQTFQVIAVTEEGDWYRVLAGGELGWVSADTISVTGNRDVIDVVQKPSPSPTPTETPEPTATETPTETPEPVATATIQIRPTTSPPPPPNPTEIALLQEEFVPFHSENTHISLLQPSDWVEPVGSNPLFVLTAEDTDGTQIIVTRGEPSLLEIALLDIETTTDPVTTLKNASVHAGVDPETAEVVALEGYRVPAWNLSNDFGFYNIEAFIWDLAPENPGTDWLIMYGIIINRANHEEFLRTIFYPIIASLEVDGQPLSAADTPNESADRPLEFNQTRSYNLPARQAHAWRFEAQSGQTIRIEMIALEPNLDPYLTLLNAEGEIIAEDDDSGLDVNARLEYTIEETGQYTVLARYFSLTDKGPYQITLKDVQVAVNMGGVILPDQEIQGEINDSLPVSDYLFEGISGQTVSIQMGSTNSELDAYLILLAPDGSILDENDDYIDEYDADEVDLFYPSDAALLDIELPATGTYTIRATRYQMDEGLSAGPFWLLLEVE